MLYVVIVCCWGDAERFRERARAAALLYSRDFFVWVLYAARMDAAATLDNLGLIWKFFPLGSFHVIFSVSLFLIGVVQLMNFWIGYFPSIWVVWPSTITAWYSHRFEPAWLSSYSTNLDTIRKENEDAALNQHYFLHAKINHSKFCNFARKEKKIMISV